MKFNKETVEYFSASIRYNVATFIDLYSIFISDYQKRIENYFKFNDSKVDVEAFDFLNSLIEEATKINDLIKINKKDFYRIDHWEFACFIDDIRNNLDTVQNTSKWVGSSKSKNNWRSVSVQTTYTLGQNETLESVVENNYGGDIQNDWMKLAIQNNLFEKDYNTEGGATVLINKNMSTSPKYFIRSVVDSLADESLYGLDIYKKITFENEDIKVNSYQETIKQSVYILASLKKGDVPEYPKFGIDRQLGVGSNLGVLIYSSIVRQLEMSFASDDTLSNFNIIDIGYDNTNLMVDYTIDTFYNNTINSKIPI